MDWTRSSMVAWSFVVRENKQTSRLSTDRRPPYCVSVFKNIFQRHVTDDQAR